MRRYNIVSGIFLILSIIDFALAAPVLVQEKRRAYVDVAHIPKDVTTVLGKRVVAEEIEKLEAEYFKTWRNPFGSSDAHASTSSAPPGPDHEPTKPSNSKPSGFFNWNFLKNLKDTLLPRPAASKETGQAPENQAVHVVQPNPGPSTDSNVDWNHWINQVNHEDLPPPRPASSKEIGQAPGNEAVHVVQPNPGSSTDSDLDWRHWINRVKYEYLPPPRPASSKEIGKAPENQAEHVVQPDKGPSRDPNFDWDSWVKKVNPDYLPPPRAASSKEIGQAPENQAVHVVQPDKGPSRDPNFDWHYWVKKVNPDWNHRMNQVNHEPEDLLPQTNSGFKYHWKSLKNWMYSWVGPVDPLPRPAPSKPSNPESSSLTAGPSSGTAGPSSGTAGPSSGTAGPSSGTAGSSSGPKPDSGPNLKAAPRPLRIEPLNEPEYKVLKPPSPESTDPVDHQSSSTDIPPELSPEDREAAIYAAKGKAKVSRRISGTARDVGNATQRELQPAERSLDPGDLMLRIFE